MEVFIIFASFLLSIASAENSIQVVGEKNATKATYEDAPWIVSLQMYEKDFAYCGATLITEPKPTPEKDTTCLAWIVTAASCLEGVPQIIATLGQINLEGNDGFKLDFEQIDPHEHYDAETNMNDIALIKVSFDISNMSNTMNCTVVPYLDYVQKPADINETAYDYINATVFGWGLQAEDGPLQKELYQVMAPLQTDLVCANYYGTEVFNGTSMICAGATDLGPCSYDTGGPLVCKWVKPDEEQTKYLCGIASFGSGCGRVYRPGIFTDVNNFNDWINEKIKENEDEINFVY